MRRPASPKPELPGLYLVTVGCEDRYVASLVGAAPFMCMWWAIRVADGKMWGGTAAELFAHATGWKKLE
jgi:hypothetical protein